MKNDIDTFGYYLIMDNGEKYGPVEPDNPKYDRLHPSVGNKTVTWAKKLNQEWVLYKEST